MKPLDKEKHVPDLTAQTSAGTPAPVDQKKFYAALAKRVQESSKKGRLTPVESAVPTADVGLEERDATIAELTSARYGDIDVVFNTGTAYLFSTSNIKSEEASHLAKIDQFRLRLLKQVRENSQLAGKPTRLESVKENTVPTPSSDDIKVCLAEIANDVECKDVKPLSAYSGAVYLYSDTYLPKEEAEKLARIEEFHVKVLKRVRENTKYKTRLTRAEALNELVPDVQPGEVEAACAEVTKKHPDVHSLVAKTGAVYLFSEIHMTNEYAQMLLRVEAKDPCFLIAETVRDESKVYPRPTDIELFKYGLFDLDLEQLDKSIEDTQSQYEDIRLIRVPDGPVYLYSNLYLNEDDARAFIDVIRRNQRD